MTRAFIHTVLARRSLSPSPAVRASAQPVPSDEQQALRARIEQRYDVVPLSGGVALTPKSPRGDVRLIEISDTIAINGVVVSGRELRDRVGADADPILRLSYLGASNVRRLFASAAPAPAPATRRAESARVRKRKFRRTRDPPERATPSPSDRERPSRRFRRLNGDRVRVFGDVVVNEGEEVTGQVVAVLGSVRIDGEVRQQVVSVLGTVELGPHAVIHGDVVTVGGRLRRDPAAQVAGSVTEVSLGDFGGSVKCRGWADGAHSTSAGSGR